MKNRKYYLALGSMIVVMGAFMGIAYASFTDQAKFTGSRFSVGSADLKLLNDLAGGTSAENLVDSKPAPNYDSVSPQWQADYLVKVYNNGTQAVTLTSNMDYLTANDPGNIREFIYMEPFDWDDVNNNGMYDGETELGSSHTKKAFTAWKSTGFNFGQLDPGTTRSLIMRFSTGSISSSSMGKSGVFDFMFDAVSI